MWSLRCFIILYMQILSGFKNWDIQDLSLRGYEISLTFTELFIIEKYVKIRFKNRGPPCYFLEVKRSKILQKLNERGYCFNILGFIFYTVSRAKTDLHSKYTFNFVLGSFFEQDHLLTLSWQRPLSYRNQFIDFALQINGLVSIW